MTSALAVLLRSQIQELFFWGGGYSSQLCCGSSPLCVPSFCSVAENSSTPFTCLSTWSRNLCSYPLPSLPSMDNTQNASTHLGSRGKPIKSSRSVFSRASLRPTWTTLSENKHQKNFPYFPAGVNASLGFLRNVNKQ